ncbi:MAG: haloacid dehalogenase-like hydrolase [Thermanaerothrix sp.]|nr:haloacid dehalogenase-like hydrolase [Thermanaerothrix sp.]
MRRMLDLHASHVKRLTGRDLLDSIRLSEGRTVACEVIATAQPLLGDISNPELAKAMGADLVILNLLDLQNPVVGGLPEGDGIEELFRSSFHQGHVRPTTHRNPIALAGDMTGCPIGVNLEPMGSGDMEIPPGRSATAENAKRAVEMGASLLVITANPYTGVGTADIIASVRSIREELGDVIIGAGKMHAAGSDSPWKDMPKTAAELVKAGADLVLIPCPGTVPGLSEELFALSAEAVHKAGGLVMSTIGTSQEGADRDTIGRLALMAKMGGADVQHIGDSGYSGIAVPENIMALSMAIRGRRHTLRRMARSIAR